MGRKRLINETDSVVLQSTGETKLQKASDRRAVVQLLVDRGGKLTMREINDHFGFDISSVVRSLIRTGWLEVSE